MSMDYPDVGSLYGYDPYDPLGFEGYLKKRKEEEEAERLRKAQEDNTLMGRLLGIVREGMAPEPDFIRALSGSLSLPSRLAKTVTSDYPISRLSGLKEIRPSEELLANALFPERLPGDVRQVTPLPSRYGDLPPQPRPETEMERQAGDISQNILRRGITTVGGLALDPTFPFIGAEGLAGKALSGAFLPGIAQSLGESAGRGISAVESGNIPGAAGEFTQTLLDALFLKPMTSHLARPLPKPGVTSEARQSDVSSLGRDVSEFAEDIKLEPLDEVQPLGYPFQGEPTIPGTARREVPAQSAARDVRGFVEAILRQTQDIVAGETEGYGTFTSPTDKAEFLSARVVPEETAPYGQFGQRAIGQFTGRRAIADYVSDEIRAGREPSPDAIRDFMSRVGQLMVSPEELVAHSRNPTDLVHNLVGIAGHEAGWHTAASGHPDPSLWDRQSADRVGPISPRGMVGETPPLAATLHESEYTGREQAAVVKDRMYQTPIVQNLLATAEIPGSPINRAFWALQSLKRSVPLEPPTKVAPRPADIPLRGSLESLLKPERPVEPLGMPPLTPEQQAGRARLEAQLAREEAKRKIDLEIDRLTQESRNAKLSGDVNKANELNRQIMDLRNTELPVIPPKPPEVSTFREPTAAEIIEKARKAEGVTEPVTKPEAPEKVTEPPIAERVVSAPANLLRKVLGETGLTRFNVNTLKESLKAKGVELPAEVEGALPSLLGELKDRGWIQEKVGGTYTLLAGPPKTKAGIAKGKPTATTDIVEQMEKTIEALPAKPTEKVSEPTKVEPTEQVVDTTPVPKEPRKGLPTKEELEALGEALGARVTRKGKTPEEIRLAREAAMKGGGKPPKKPPTEETPPTPEEVPEGPTGSYEVTLNDGSTHLVRARSAEEAQTKAEYILNQGGSSKVVEKVEPHLTTLERAAKYEVEPVKAGSEAVTEELKDIRKAQSEEVKETGRTVKYGEQLSREQFREKKAKEKEATKEAEALSREEEKLRREQAREKFAKKPFSVTLSNGRVVTVKARNEKVAREIAERKARKLKPGITVTDVKPKPSALEAAIMGVSRKLEESKLINSPAAKALNFVKSIAFGGDVGHLLRQGKQMNADLLFSKHAKQVWKQIPVLWKLAKGGMKQLEALNEKLYSDPDLKLLVDDFGLDMPGMGEHFKEEAFHGADWSEKVPILGKQYVARSEAVYTGGLNFLRAAEAKKWVESLRKDGFTPENAPEKYGAVARALNIISQRGQFDPHWQKILSDASTIFGAPRAKVARYQNLFELVKGGTSGDIVRTTAAKTLAFNLGIYGILATTTGAKFVTDRESSDFLKIRISPKIAIDPWMGLGVTARSIAKFQNMAEGKKVLSPYTGKKHPTNFGEILKDEFVGSIAPAIKLAIEAYTGKDLRGYEIERIESLLNVAPLTAKSIVELLRAGDIEQALSLSVLQAAGEGVDVFDYEKAKAKQERLKKERGLTAPRGTQAPPPLNWSIQ